METYATALLYAIPLFVVLLLIEFGYGALVKKQTYTVMDTVSSISSGLVNVIKDSLGLVVILVSYPFLLDYLAIFQLQNTWLLWLVAFVAIDFAGYWNHRLSHRVNIFWNQHVIHHSSEEFNLACALRQSISNVFGYFPLLLLPAAILGVPNEIIAVIAPVHLFAQFWYHTQHIGKMGVLEYVIVTPSQHRVHHAINPEYIDKNFGQILCIWDRLFGSFQEELAEIPPQYGVLKPAATWNPVLINFQHVWRICKDAWRTKNWLDKLRIWVMPTGWRPADVQEQYPIEIVTDVYGFKRYKTPFSNALKGYSMFQMIGATALLLLLFSSFSALSYVQLLYFGAAVFIAVYGYTTVMDGVKYGYFIEIARSALALGILFFTSNWFGLREVNPEGFYGVVVYYSITVLWVMYMWIMNTEGIFHNKMNSTAV